MPGPIIATTSPAPAPVVATTTGTPGGQNPMTPGYYDPALGGNVGNSTAPINNVQQASLFVQPQTVAGVNNSIGQNIQGALDLSHQQANTVQNPNSTLAGLTTLGAANQAGN